MNDVPQNELLYRNLISRVQLRMLRSAAWAQPWHEKAVRYYKIWRKIKDAAYDPDEPNLFLGYAFSIVEQIHSKITEPILKMRPPCDVLPMRFGQGRQADNFKAVCRNWYAKPNMQEPFCRSKKEMCIVGTRFEIDEWQNKQLRGKMWGKAPKEIPLILPNGEVMVGPDGKPMTTTVMVDAEVERTIPVHYGFNTRYPSFFNVYPEPNRPTIGTGARTDCAWLIEDMGELAIADMIGESYVDPHDKKVKPLYDFDRLLHDAGRKAEERYKRIRLGESADDTPDNYGPLIVPVNRWSQNTDYGREDKDSVAPSEGSVDRQSSEDRDKIWVVREMQGDSLVTIANGAYIIQRVKCPWHVPEMPARVENYTQDPEFLYGLSVISPIEDEIYELNDIHNLAMSNWIRIINKMVAVSAGAIVSMDDFRPRAGGKIRIRGDVDVRTAIQSVDQDDPTLSMLHQESNVRGLIEFTSSQADMSPGTSGTKQTHKTYKGMVEIQNQLAVRFLTMQRQALINEARRMMSMERFFSQFQFEKTPFRIYRDDGSTALAEFNKDDIFTDGIGFEFAIELDLNFGDTAVTRQQNLFLFDRAVEYMRTIRQLGLRKAREIDLSVLFEQNLRDFGRVDTTRLFKLPTEEITPEDELGIVMQGGVAECAGDLQDHIETHLLQIGSPNLKRAIEAGKASPDTIRRLQLMVQQAMARLTTFVRDPQAAADQKRQRALMAPNVGMGMNGGAGRAGDVMPQTAEASVNGAALSTSMEPERESGAGDQGEQSG